MIDWLIRESVNLVNDNQEFIQVTWTQVAGVYGFVTGDITRRVARWNWKMWGGPLLYSIFCTAASLTSGITGLVVGKNTGVLKELLTVLDGETVWDPKSKELITGGVVFNLCNLGKGYTVNKATAVDGQDVVTLLCSKDRKVLDYKVNRLVFKITEETRKKAEEEAAEKIRKSRDLTA